MLSLTVACSTGDDGEDASLSSFVDRAEGTIANPYLVLLKLNRLESSVVPSAPLDASYSGLDDQGSLPMDKFYAERPIVVADDGSTVVFGAEGDGSGALATMDDPTAADLEGVPEVAVALDESAVYAAALFFAGGDTAGDDAVLDEPWVRAGLGTSIEDGQSRAVMALWHADDAAAATNDRRAAELLGELTECTDESEVDHEGQLVVASCAVEEPGFVQRTVSRLPTGPLFD